CVVVRGPKIEIKKPGIITLSHMGPRTRPRPIPRFLNHARAHRVQFYIAQRYPSMSLVQRTRIESILPEMPGLALLHVMPERIFFVCPPKSLGKRILRLRHHKKMNMVGHEAVADYRHPMSNTRSAQNIQIDSPLTIV